MSVVVQMSLLLVIYVALQIQGGLSEELYPNLKCHQGVKEEYIDVDYMKEINDFCSSEEKRKAEVAKFPLMNSRRGCLMTKYSIIYPISNYEAGTREHRIDAENVDGAVMTILLKGDNERWNKWTKEELAHRKVIGDLGEILGEKIENACSAKLEEVKNKPEEEWTAVYDCIDDILVCKG